MLKIENKSEWPADTLYVGSAGTDYKEEVRKLAKRKVWEEVDLEMAINSSFTVSIA